MKNNIKLLVLAICTSLFLMGCSQKTNEIQVEDLKTPCDFVNAVGKVADEMIKKGGTSNSRDLSTEQKLELEKLDKVMKTLKSEIHRKNFPIRELEKCPDFKSVDKKMKLLGL
jgi:hypothetical protein